MTGVVLPLVATAAALVVTYLCCIRPMRRRGLCGSETSRSGMPDPVDLDARLAEARAELAPLRAAPRSDEAGRTDEAARADKAAQG